MGVDNDLLNNARAIRRILCPAENAFEKYEKIFDEARKVDQDVLVLIALGPAATVLSYDLFKAGFRALDVGHLDIEYEWFLRKATGKNAVYGKYVVEAGYTNVPDIDDQKYFAEIVQSCLPYQQQPIQLYQYDR